MLVCGRKLLFNKLDVDKRYTKRLGVLNILRNEVEIERCVTVRQHVLWITNRWMFLLRYTWQLLVGNVCNAQRHHCGLPKGFLIHCRASIEYIIVDCTVGYRAQGGVH